MTIKEGRRRFNGGKPLSKHNFMADTQEVRGVIERLDARDMQYGADVRDLQRIWQGRITREEREIILDIGNIERMWEEDDDI